MLTQNKMPPRRPALLIIMDGIGVNPSKKDNAVALADTPNMDDIYSRHPLCLLEASGRAVGLPDGQMGNSEVGHLTLGAGTVLRQDLVKITDSIRDGSFASNAVITAALNRSKAADKPLHLLGLVSTGGVHSHLEHLIALIELCQQTGVRPVIHMITDGRDTAPESARGFLQTLEKSLVEGGEIATVTGRYFAMDRDNRWDRIELAWRAVVEAQGRKASNAQAALELAREQSETDEFITPTVLDTHKPLTGGEEVFFFNFRNDRPRELSEALGLTDFQSFDRGDFEPVNLSTMTRYQTDYPFEFAFSRDKPGETLGRVVSDAGLSQLRSAETEKYPHVTFFFNGGQDAPLDQEVRALVDSPKVSTYDLQPQMSAELVTDGIIAALRQREHALIVVNLANGDMVGHTGVRSAVIEAVEVVDTMVGQLWKTAVQNDYSIVLTADHGNADMLIDPNTGGTHTQHTTFPVACVIHDEFRWELSSGSSLTSVAPTILQLMGLSKPKCMAGESVLLRQVDASIQ